MKGQFNKLVNEANGIRSNIYYQLNQLSQITGLSNRMLKYKMKLVKQKYEGVENLLWKDGKRWQIHYTLISEFMPVNRKKTNNENNYNWQCFVTWNPFQNYDADYHIKLIKEIKTNLPDNTIKYVIELDKRGYNHVHYISDATVPITKETVEKVILKYFSWDEVTYQVTEINNKYSSVSYINKAPIRNGIL